MNREQIENYIRERNFAALFTESGWDSAGDDRRPIGLQVGDKTVTVRARHAKSGFAVCFCEDEAVLDMGAQERKKLMHQLSKYHYEHLLIAHTAQRQRWMVSIRPQDRGLRIVTEDWRAEQDIQGLYEKLQGLIFPVEDEDRLNIAEVVSRVRSSFGANAEAVTRKFYSRFQGELQTFDEFIEGIENRVTRRQYAVLMLNRLMFIYFVQKKHFLDDDPRYLQNRLQKTKEAYGEDQFHNRFYKAFLRELFHKGFNTPAAKRDAETVKLLGRVPYLNGGLFDLHETEADESIAIPDKAFERLFEFFDTYNWHLDTRADSTGRDINPDVLGYIFEKYINDRAAKGAYYTKEDITNYIAKNTILPFLLNQTRKNCKNAFEGPASVWRLLQDNPDNYIYGAARRGCDIPDEKIPDNIRRGIDANKPDLLERRKDWNKPAPEEFGLKRETWREVIARRQRYAELKGKMKRGEISDTTALIANNLDIERFVADAIYDYEGSDFISAMFKAIAGVKYDWVKNTNQKSKRGISVLDPACGSGAFLFAALNVLEPVYERCISRMDEFVTAHDQFRKSRPESRGRGKYLFFSHILDSIAKHSNPKYWIYKTIILENLYGVDMMKEATEIAKLRLFLKLAAEAEYNPAVDNLGLEPLPDIDYNIRAGNALVGFATMAQFDSNVASKEGMLAGGIKQVKVVREKAQEVGMINLAFRNAQDRHTNGNSEYIEAKQELGKVLGEFNEELNKYAAELYGIMHDVKPDDYARWKESHQPFHWFAEFYDIIENGGFDVVIGNPPYVVYSAAKKQKDSYTIKGYRTEKCDNLWGFFTEAAVTLLKQGGDCGMIVPIALPSTNLTKVVRKNLISNSRHLFISSYAKSPSALFNGVRQRISIFLCEKANKAGVLGTTELIRWFGANRADIFNLISYNVREAPANPEDVWRKFQSSIHHSMWAKMQSAESSILNFMKNLKKPQGSDHFYLNMTLESWIKCSFEHQASTAFRIFAPLENGELSRDQLAAALSTSALFWVWEVTGDCWHLTKRELALLKIDVKKLPPSDLSKLTALGLQLTEDLEKNKKEVNTAQTQYTYHHRESKPIMDDIDRVLAKHYGFTEEELDCLINHAIKYRMGVEE